MSVLKLSLLLVLTCNQYFRKYFKLVHRKNVVMLTLTTGIIFLLLLVCSLRRVEFYEGCPRVPRTRMKLSTITEGLRNPALHNRLCYKLRFILNHASRLTHPMYQRFINLLIRGLFKKVFQLHILPDV
jgi:hypothetical protein